MSLGISMLRIFRNCWIWWRKFSKFVPSFKFFILVITLFQLHRQTRHAKRKKIARMGRPLKYAILFSSARFLQVFEWIFQMIVILEDILQKMANFGPPHGFNRGWVWNKIQHCRCYSSHTMSETRLEGLLVFLLDWVDLWHSTHIQEDEIRKIFNWQHYCFL